MQIVKDGLWLCVDCTVAAVNGDVSGVESAERVAAIDKGLEALGPHLVSVSDSESGRGFEEFSRRQCACCHGAWGGTWHEFAILGD